MFTADTAMKGKLRAGPVMNLTLALLRILFPALPVLVFGNGMIKRCLSLVAVDYSHPQQVGAGLGWVRGCGLGCCAEPRLRGVGRLHWVARRRGCGRGRCKR